jgi:hypothetical protein
MPLHESSLRKSPLAQSPTDREMAATFAPYWSKARLNFIGAGTTLIFPGEFGWPPKAFAKTCYFKLRFTGEVGLQKSMASTAIHHVVIHCFGSEVRIHSLVETLSLCCLQDCHRSIIEAVPTITLRATYLTDRQSLWSGSLCTETHLFEAEVVAHTRSPPTTFQTAAAQSNSLCKQQHP